MLFDGTFFPSGLNSENKDMAMLVELLLFCLQ